MNRETSFAKHPVKFIRMHVSMLHEQVVVR